MTIFIQENTAISVFWKLRHSGQITLINLILPLKIYSIEQTSHNGHSWKVKYTHNMAINKMYHVYIKLRVYIIQYELTVCVYEEVQMLLVLMLVQWSQILFHAKLLWLLFHFVYVVKMHPENKKFTLNLLLKKSTEYW